MTHPAPDPKTSTMTVDGRHIGFLQGQSVASALLSNGIYMFRQSPNQAAPRGAFCLMGACQECAILIDGHMRRACQTKAAPGLKISLRGAGT